MERLFNDLVDSGKNLLPADGNAFYHEQLLDAQDAADCFGRLLKEVDWQQDELIMFGKKIVTKREVAWYGDEGLTYTYSGRTKTPLSWTPLLLGIKEKVEQRSNETYNSCLLNLYHDGEEGMGWHADNEKELKKQGTIASVSFGAERRFQFKHRENNQKVELLLASGSLLLMSGTIQDHWLHRLPPMKAVKEARINLTFRTIMG